MGTRAITEKDIRISGFSGILLIVYSLKEGMKNEEEWNLKSVAADEHLFILASIYIHI